MEQTNPTPVGDSTLENITPIQSPPVETPPKKKPIKILLIIFAILLAIFVILYALFSMDYFDQFNLFSNDENTEENEDIEEENLITFEGETITANMPEGWSIEEYYNGEGTDMLTEGITYTGLTGLKIFKNESEIFFLKAIYGIGFVGCSHYSKFTDENPEYWAQIESDNEEIGETTEVSDYTSTDYEEFEWLGTTFRRIEKFYDYDTVEGNEYFESSCVPSILTLDGLTFSPSGAPDSNSYDYGPTDVSTLDDLEIVDSILESMTLSN